MVHTRSGLTTGAPEPDPVATSEVDDHEVEESLEKSELEEPTSTPLQIPGDNLPVASGPQFRFWKDMTPQERVERLQTRVSLPSSSRKRPQSSKPSSVGKRPLVPSPALSSTFASVFDIP